MSHAAPADPHGHVPADQPWFPPREWAAFQADDRHSCGVIAGLMAGIFSTGLVLYSIVAWIVAS